MDQRADDIRQDIEATRASLDTKLDTLESKARQTFDLNHQVAERPWMALGAAIAAGYVLGSLGSDEPEQPAYGQPIRATDAAYPTADAHTSSNDRFLAPFDAEIDMLKTAAITTLTNFLHDVIKEYVPSLGAQLKGTVPDSQASTPRPSRAYDQRTRTPHTPQTDSATLNDLLTGAPQPDTGRVERAHSIGADTTRY